MTGLEAWSIIAPILASHMMHYDGKLDVLDKAYVLAYGALKMYDDMSSKTEDERRESC